MIQYVSERFAFCIKNGELCIKIDELWIKITDFLIKNDECGFQGCVYQGGFSCVCNLKWLQVRFHTVFMLFHTVFMLFYTVFDQS